MAKCVVCTHLNAVEEAAKHPNPATQAAVAMTANRRRNAKPSTHPNKFCKHHGCVVVDGENVCHGKPTGKFAKGGA